MKPAKSLLATTRGFTLLELLLAISLLGIISVFIYSWLLQSGRQIAQTQEDLKSQRSLFSAIQLIKHDLLQKTNYQLVDETTLKISTYFHTSADPEGRLSVQYLSTEKGLYRQVNQESPRFICAGDNYLFSEDEDILSIQLGDESSLRLNP